MMSHTVPRLADFLAHIAGEAGRFNVVCLHVVLYIVLLERMFAAHIADPTEDGVLVHAVRDLAVQL